MKLSASVSVILVNFNQARFISDAWTSLRNQTIAPEKIFLVDDGSADEDFKAVASLVVDNAELNVQLISDRDNLGISARLNQVLPLVDTEWLLVLAADDALKPNSIELLFAASGSEADVVWGNLDVIDESGSPLGYSRPRNTWQGNVSKRYLDAGFPFNDLLKFNNFVPGGMTLIRAATVRQAGGWDANITTEDFDLWLRISRTSRFKYVDVSVGNYRVVSGSKSRRDSHKLRDQATFLSKHAGQSKEIDKGLAYLAAMRWAFTVLRTRRIPDFSLKDMCQIIGVSPKLAWSQMPRAAANPLYWSLIARVKRVT
jgi:GT2 family glycosyltransferase